MIRIRRKRRQKIRIKWRHTCLLMTSQTLRKSQMLMTSHTCWFWLTIRRIIRKKQNFKRKMKNETFFAQKGKFFRWWRHNVLVCDCWWRHWPAEFGFYSEKKKRRKEERALIETKRKEAQKPQNAKNSTPTWSAYKVPRPRPSPFVHVSMETSVNPHSPKGKKKKEKWKVKPWEKTFPKRERSSPPETKGGDYDIREYKMTS